MSGKFTYGSGRREYLTLVFNGVCSFFFGRVCQYDLNEVRGFASDIRSRKRGASGVPALNPSGLERRLVVGGIAELSEKGSLVCKHSNEPRSNPFYFHVICMYRMLIRESGRYPMPWKCGHTSAEITGDSLIQIAGKYPRMKGWM